MKAANDNILMPLSREKAAGRPCPICGKSSNPEIAPFCSKRCADVDLHRWLGGSYAIPAKDTDDASSLPDRDDDAP